MRNRRRRLECGADCTGSLHSSLGGEGPLRAACSVHAELRQLPGSSVLRCRAWLAPGGTAAAPLSAHLCLSRTASSPGSAQRAASNTPLLSLSLVGGVIVHGFPCGFLPDDTAPCLVTFTLTALDNAALAPRWGTLLPSQATRGQCSPLRKPRVPAILAEPVACLCSCPCTRVCAGAHPCAHSCVCLTQCSPRYLAHPDSPHYLCSGAELDLGLP